MSAPADDFQAVQRAFCAYVRDPENNPAPDGIDPDRMKLYGRLFFSNILNMFRDFLPVTCSLYTREELVRLARGYFSRHRSQTPYFHWMGKEFLQYLSEEHEPTEADPPFLKELVDYEWTGLNVRIHSSGEAPPSAPLDSVEDPLDHPMVLLPDHVLRMYAYPVHTISEKFRPKEPPDAPTFLLIYRAPERTRYMELNAASARLIQLLEADPDTAARAHLETIAGEMPHVPSEKVLAGGSDALSSLSERGVILGVRSLRPEAMRD